MNIKNSWKRVISATLAVLIVAGAVPANVGFDDLFGGADIVASAVTVAAGNCGTTGHESEVTWEFDTDGTLTIKGDGAMADYVPWKPAPWRENYNDSIKNIVVEDGVTHIGNYAFFSMQDSILETVTFNGDVESIGENSFQMCYTLKSVTFKGNVGSIGSGAFSSCHEMETLTFNGNVKEIGEDSFISCDNLSTVIFYGTVGTINYDAFSGCDLKNVTFSGSVGSNEGDQGIIDYAFYNCDMTTVTLIPQADGTEFTFKSNDTNSIPSAKLVYAEGNTVLFDGDTKIEAGTAMSELTNKTLTWRVETPAVLQWISNDCTVTLDNGTLTVSKTEGAATGAMADYMQYDAPWKDYSYYIKSVIVEDGVTHIGDQSFYECENLETITVNSNLASTGYQFAYSCNNLKTVTFNGNVEDFDDIYSCEKLESVTFNGNVGTIKAFGFDSNSSLKNVTFNGSVERFDYNAFVYCPSLETVTLTPQANGTLYIEEDVTDNTTAKIKYANTSGYLYDGDTKIEDEALISDLQGKTLTWGSAYKDGIGEKLYGYSLSLDGDIGVNFYMELADDIANSNTAYMQFTTPAGSETETSTVYVKDAKQKTVNGKNYYVFKCNVSAKDMASEITAQMKDGEKKGKIYTYSVKDYADYLLEHSEVEAYANAATLVKKMLNYGAASQTYFGITGTAVNADLSEADRNIGEVNIPNTFQYDPTKTNLPESVTLAGATLSLKSETSLSLYFTGLPDGTEFSCGNKTVESVKNGKYIVARIRGISSSELENDFTVTFNGGSGSVTYNAMTYCYNVLTSDTADDNLKNVCKALYQYAKEAKTYFGGNN